MAYVPAEDLKTVIVQLSMTLISARLCTFHSCSRSYTLLLSNPSMRMFFSPYCLDSTDIYACYNNPPSPPPSSKLLRKW